MRNILLCVDSSDYAVTAAKYTIDIAKLMDAHVDVLYVSELSKLSTTMQSDFGTNLGLQPFSHVLIVPENNANIISKILDAKFKKMFIDAGMIDRYKFNHKVGSFIYEISEFKSSVTGLDLIIFGKQGEDHDSNCSKVGESVESIIKYNAVPCFIANKSFRKIKKMLIAYNGSDANNKLLHFIERNSFFKNIEIHFITINADDDLKITTSTAINTLRDVAHLDVIFSEFQGNIKIIIKNYLNKHNIDLLSIGAYSHNIFSTIIFGSTTSSIIEDTTTPILIIN